MQCFYLAGIARPHEKIKFGNSFLFLCIEELREAPNLPVALLTQTVFHNFVDEVVDSLEVFFPELHSLLV